MNKQSFSEKRLHDVYSERIRKSLAIKRKPKLNSLQALSILISDRKYRISDFSSYSIKKKKTYSTTNVDDDVILSKLDKNIKNIYRINPSDRHTIIKQIISLLTEETPKYIYKFDIKDFYESINPSSHCSKIITDNILSADSIFILSEYLRVLSEMNIQGVPRGVGLSSTISEFVMRNFDQAVKANSKIYFYTRFVDDILIFSTERLDIKKEIINNLPEGLSLNWKKNKILPVYSCLCSEKCHCTTKKCACWDKCKCKIASAKDEHFDFLGYSFNFKNLSVKDSSKNIEIDISQKKAARIKSRIYLSINDYLKNGNFRLLENRIKFLTGNHFISNGKHRTDRMKSGVYYNYIHITSIKEYEKLDCYLKKMIFMKSKTNISLTETHKNTLKKYSFVSGYRNKRIETFDGNQINKIKGCWNNG